jgi:hypothetical protein
MIFIDGTLLPSPTEYHLTYQDVLGQKQVNALGRTVRDVLGKKRRVHIGYKRLPGEAAARLFSLLSPGREVLLKCPSMVGDVTFTCVCEDLSCTLFHRADGDNTWADVTVLLEEV